MRQSLSTEEGEQGFVDLFGVGPSDVVWAALDRDEGAVGDQRRKSCCGRFEWKEAVVGAVHDEHGYIDLGQVGAEVGPPGVGLSDRHDGTGASGAYLLGSPKFQQALVAGQAGWSINVLVLMGQAVERQAG